MNILTVAAIRMFLLKSNGGDSIQLYIFNIASLDEPLSHPEWKDNFSSGRWEKIIKYQQILHRKQGAGAGWLLQYAMKKNGVLDRKKELQYGKHGKPMHSDIYFNLSHSGDYVICAISKKEVGCDIQKIRMPNRNLMEKFYTDWEQDYVLHGGSQKKRKERFVTIWALKESYLKKTGEGLTRELSDISFEIGDSIVMTDNNIKMPEKFTTFYIEDYVIALCGEEDLLLTEKMNQLEEIQNFLSDYE